MKRKTKRLINRNNRIFSFGSSAPPPSAASAKLPPMSFFCAFVTQSSSASRFLPATRCNSLPAWSAVIVIGSNFPNHVQPILWRVSPLPCQTLLSIIERFDATSPTFRQLELSHQAGDSIRTASSFRSLVDSSDGKQLNSIKSFPWHRRAEEAIVIFRRSRSEKKNNKSKVESLGKYFSYRFLSPSTVFAMSYVRSYMNENWVFNCRF